MNSAVLWGWFLGWTTGHFVMAAHTANDTTAVWLVWGVSHVLALILAIATGRDEAAV